MKGIFLVKNGDSNVAFHIKDCPKPKAGKGQVLIKVECFGLNYAEVMARRGLYRDSPDLPFIPGYDFAGIAEEVGEGVDSKIVGNRVMGLSKFGAYAEYVVCEESLLCKMPEKMTLEEGTAIGVQYNTAYYMTSNLGKLIPQDRVLLRAAAGGVGTALIQLLQKSRCEIIAVVGNEEKKAQLKQKGIDKTYNYRSSSDMLVFEKESRNKYDVIFNPVGGKTYKNDMKRLAFGGKMILFGASSRSGVTGLFADVRFLIQMGLQIPIFLLAKSQTIIGVNMLKIASLKPSIISKNMRELSDLYNEGLIQPKIDRIYDASKIAEAHEYLESGKSSGKIVLRWE